MMIMMLIMIMMMMRMVMIMIITTARITGSGRSSGNRVRMFSVTEPH